MKRIGMIGTAVLSLTLGVAAPAYAQQEQRDPQEEKKAQPDKSAKPAEKGAEQQNKNTKPEEKAVQQQDKNAKNEEKNAQQQQQHTQQAQSGKQEQRAGGNAGGRIPDDRYRANFGQEHRFHVSQADYGRDRRFQYGGYWFGFVDPWPGNWLYTQDVYVVEINGVYYLCNPMYPGVNILLSVTL
jgi:phage repressor protein C with HTH and peptisase S24 domain